MPHATKMIELSTQLAALQHPPPSRLARPTRTWLNLFSSSSAALRTTQQRQAASNNPHFGETKQESGTTTERAEEGKEGAGKTMDDVKFPLSHRAVERVPQLIIKNETEHKEAQARAEAEKAKTAYKIALMDVASV